MNVNAYMGNVSRLNLQGKMKPVEPAEEVKKVNEKLVSSVKKPIKDKIEISKKPELSSKPPTEKELRQQKIEEARLDSLNKFKEILEKGKYASKKYDSTIKAINKLNQGVASSFDQNLNFGTVMMNSYFAESNRLMNEKIEDIMKSRFDEI